LLIIDGKDKICKQMIEAVDHQKKSITWKVIGGDLLELYNSFTITTSHDHQWTTWTFVYEKKTEDTPDPLVLLGFVLHLTKDIEGHLLKTLLIIDGKDKICKQVIEAVDHQKKSITWKVIGGDLLELYNSFTITTSHDHQWTTWTFVYEKKTEDTPDPLVLLGFVLHLTKDIEGHLLK
ncbi:MLP-like protein 34, partial [Nicotiana tomentosiformis]|uniref:MLP-like protein 34 n=1 Tax=Nicotiana tomentosiformis TaxID=4098 RepID=UPI00388CD6A6